MEKKKRIGILTMHAVINYGSFLQAWASQRTIEDFGFECEIIDYRFPNKWHYSLGISKKSLKNIIKYKLSVFGLTASQRKYFNIKKAVNKHLNLSASYKTPQAIKNNPPQYDVYVVGSDQTWNPKHMKGDTTFLLSFAPKEAIKISMSASVSCSNFEKKYAEIFKNQLVEFSDISIRETNSVKLISELSNKPVTVTLDPTLLLESIQWDGLISKSKFKGIEQDYIVFYLITHSFNPGKYIFDQLKALQQKTKLKVLSFTNIPEEHEVSTRFVGDAGPEDFLKIFKNASYVVTTSFHGTAFALNFGIPLYSVIKSKTDEDNRQLSLLRSVDAQKCAVAIGTNFEDIDPNYNNKLIQDNLSSLRDESIAFLRNSINKPTVLN